MARREAWEEGDGGPCSDLAWVWFLSDCRSGSDPYELSDTEVVLCQMGGASYRPHSPEATVQLSLHDKQFLVGKCLVDDCVELIHQSDGVLRHQAFGETIKAYYVTKHVCVCALRSSV